jgi:hypothetical protein
VCHAFLHGLALECGCSPGRAVCLADADLLCGCEPSSWRLLFRNDLGELQGLLAALQQRVGLVGGPGAGVGVPSLPACLPASQPACLRACVRARNRVTVNSWGYVLHSLTQHKLLGCMMGPCLSASDPWLIPVVCLKDVCSA